jgi:hypothetical protein
MERYDPAAIEARWQKIWRDQRIHEVPNPEPGEDTSKLMYVLEMLPYPSGELHMGHVKNYTMGDVVTLYKRRNGHRVMHPMGYDAFGLPAEQYAVRTGTHPRTTTEENITRYRAQLRRLGFAGQARVVPGDHTEEAGIRAAAALAAGHILPTAVITSNDRCAVGLLDAFARLGADVPGAISVVGYDDSMLARLAHVDLTTVSQDAHEQAGQAVALAVERLESGRAAPREVVLTPRLVLRSTTAERPAGLPRPVAVHRCGPVVPQVRRCVVRRAAAGGFRRRPAG